jgi:uncharacterized protein YndB with AHSA1/START domain
MRTIHHVLDIDVSADSAWAALTERDKLAGWWSTKLEIDQGSTAGPGSRIYFTFGGDFNPVMEVTKVSGGRQLGWRCVGGHENWDDNTFTFELVPLDGGKTRLRFTQDYATELSDDDYGVYNFNWGYYLESLRLLCTTGAGKPYDPGVRG